jgi:choline dehydrogenase-like flavoprotein
MAASESRQYDIIIIGSGAGGGTIAQALAPTSARILILEQGDFVPQEEENWSATEVWKNRRYRARERWRDEQGREFVPYTHYCVGGNTRFWGSALFRLRREDFQQVEHLDGVSPAWPIDYDTLAPYYDRGERLYQVHGEAGVDPTEPPRGPFPFAAIPHSAQMEEVVRALRGQGLHPFPLPLGLIRPGEPGGCQLCTTCNSFPCKLRMKGDAQSCCIEEAISHPNVTLWTNTRARRLVTDAAGSTVAGVEVERDGETLRVAGSLVIASCGAVNSAALLLRSATPAHPQGLANSSGLVGRRYMAHHATMISAFDRHRRNTTMFQKTVAINDFYMQGPGGYPLGQIQSQGRTEAVTLKSETPWYGRPIPMWAWERWAERAVDWLAMSEDLPSEENRVTVDSDGHIRLTYRQNNLRPHQELVARTKDMLKRAGFGPIVQHSLGTRNTTHQCGTLCFGTDPGRSVLDPFCRTHDISNLFVVDASFFPSAAAVNPGLTIIAQALRVADHIRETDLT